MIQKVSNKLLLPNALELDQLQSMLALAHEHKLDYSDLYFQDSHHETWTLEDGRIKNGSFHIEQGLGVRAITGEKTGFAYADEISAAALKRSVLAARSIASRPKQNRSLANTHGASAQQSNQPDSILHRSRQNLFAANFRSTHSQS